MRRACSGPCATWCSWTATFLRQLASFGQGQACSQSCGARHASARLQDCVSLLYAFKFYQQEAVDGLLCGGQPLHVALSNLPRSVQQEVLWSLWAEEEDCAGMKRESFRLWALQVMLLQRSAEVCRPGTANAEKPGSFSMCKHTLRCSPRQRRTAAQGQSLLIKLPCIAKP